MEMNSVNIPYDGAMPEVVERSDDVFCTVMLSDNEDDPINTLYKFNHKDRGGIDHSSSIICKDDLNTLMVEIVKNFSDERFTKCFDTECNATLYPQEIKTAVPDETYQKYRKLFNAKMSMKGGKRKLRKPKKKSKKTRKIKNLILVDDTK